MTQVSNKFQIAEARTIEEAAEALDRDGVAVLPGILSGEDVKQLREELYPVLDSLRFGDDEVFSGNRTRRAGGMLARTTMTATVLTHPLVLGTAEKVLCTPTKMWFGEEEHQIAPTLQISATQAIQIHPGQGGQPLHRDDIGYHTSHPEAREIQIGIMIAVTDFTEENGATRVLPGSHRWTDENPPLASETIPAEMKAGSVLIWYGSTYHGGGQNLTDEPRTGIVSALNHSYLRQEENHYLTIPRETVETLPRQIQELIGYKASTPFLGWVEVDGQMSDPSILLASVDAGSTSMSSTGVV